MVEDGHAGHVSGQQHEDHDHEDPRSLDHYHHAHHIPESTVAVSWALLVFVFLTLASVYVLSAERKRFARSFGRVMCMMVSVFCAMSLCKIISTLVFRVLLSAMTYESEDSDAVVGFFIGYGIYVLLLGLLNSVCFKYKDNPDALFAYSTLWGHTAGFVGQKAVAELQHSIGQEFHMTGEWLAAVGGAALTYGVLALADYSRRRWLLPTKRWTQAVSHDERDNHYGAPHFLEELLEAEDDAAAIVVSLSFWRVTVYPLVGHSPVMHFRAVARPAWHVIVVILIGISWQVPFWLFTGLRKRWGIQFLSNPAHKRLADQFHILFGFIGSWHIAGSIQWTVCNVYHKLVGGTLDEELPWMLAAPFGSVVGVIYIDIMDRLEEKDIIDAHDLEASLACVGMFAGICWEHAWYSAFQASIEGTPCLRARPNFSRAGMNFFFVFCILPAWRKHLVPFARVDHEQRAHSAATHEPTHEVRPRKSYSRKANTLYLTMQKEGSLNRDSCNSTDSNHAGTIEMSIKELHSW